MAEERKEKTALELELAENVEKKPLTQRQRAFKRLLNFITKNINDNEDGNAAIDLAERMYNEESPSKNEKNGNHAYTVPGIKTAIVNHKRFSKYFPQKTVQDTLEAARAKYK